LVAPTATQIAERAEDRERLRRLFADLEQLPDRQRGALVMRELSGLSFEEIAKAFETTPATARQTVYEARLSLRQMEEGREMRCEAATRALSEADGRSRRRRDLRAHLRHCASCRAFAAEIDERRSKLAALAPLPLVASSGILHGVLAGKASGALASGTTAGGAGGAGTLGGATAGGAGKVVAGSAIAKSAATVAVAAVVGVSAAGRAGLIDVPLAADDGGSSQTAPGPAATSAASAGAREEKSAPSSRQRKAQAHSAGAAGSAGGGTALSAAGQPNSAADESGRPSSAGPASHGLSNPHGHGPSGGKQGRSQRGRPAASAKGQQTATAHKSPHANRAARGGPRARQRAHPEAPTASPGKAGAPAGQARTPTAPPAETGQSGSGPTQGADTPDSLEQSASGSKSIDGEP
jgi:hypothetical protein